jgi:Bacterial regulatory protein, arsR family
MKFSLGVSSLPPAEAALIGTILRLSSQLAGAWEVSTEADCDVVMIDPAKTGLSWTGKQFETQILVPIVAANSPFPAGSYSLERPFKAERFIALLMRLEGDLTNRSQHVPGATPLAAAPRTPSGERRAKLTRWPLGEMAATNLSDIRMMTMLSARAYSVNELAKSTGKSAAAVSEHFTKLDELGYLHWSSGMASVNAANVAQAPAPAARNTLHPMPRQSSFSRNLIGLIRSRLGLA